MRIESGGGTPYEAAVNEKLRLLTEASTSSAQSRASFDDGKAFQVSTVPVTVTDTDQEILILKNNSRDDYVVITYIRLMSAGVAAWNVGGYFTLNVGGDYTSGGSEVTPTNVNTGSGLTSLDLACYDGNTPIVLSGTQTEIDRNYCANEMQTYNKEGSLVIAPGGLFSINHIGSTVAGSVYSRISFYLREKSGD